MVNNVKKSFYKTKAASSFRAIQLQGHLFDAGTINKVLDHIEDCKASCRVLDWEVGANRDATSKGFHLLFKQKITNYIRKSYVPGLYIYLFIYLLFIYLLLEKWFMLGGLGGAGAWSGPNRDWYVIGTWLDF